MKTIILICGFVYSLLSNHYAVASSACEANVNAGTLSAFFNYCARNKAETVDPSVVQSGPTSGESLKSRLESGPNSMSCQLKSTVYECRGMVGAYPQPVRIYFKAAMTKPDGLNVHFHGHYLKENGPLHGHYPFQPNNGDYAKMLARSKSQKILVIPESYGERVSTYTREFNSARKWRDFRVSLGQTIGLKSAIPFGLSGHSGADKSLDLVGRYCISKEWKCGVKSVGLFDANFGNGSVGREGLWALTKTVARNGGVVYIRDSGQVAKTIQNNNVLVQAIDPERVDRATVNTRHMAIMKSGGFASFLDSF